jgi:hypothetical protein
LGTIWEHARVKKRKRDEGGEENSPNFIKMDLKASFYNILILKVPYKIGLGLLTN